MSHWPSRKVVFVYRLPLLPQWICHKKQPRKIATYARRTAKKRLILAARGVANLIQLTTGQANEPWNVVRAGGSMEPSKSLRELGYTANFVYTTYPRFTPLCFRNLNHFSNSWLFPQVNRFRPDSALGIMIALMYSVARL
jgi:hypothetical protein